MVLKVKVYKFNVKPEIEENLPILSKTRDIYAKKEQVKFIYNLTELGVSDLIYFKDFLHLLEEFEEETNLYMHSSECVVNNILVKKAAENILKVTGYGVRKPVTITVAK